LLAYQPTIGADFREVAVSDSRLQVWDTSGDKKMLALGRSIHKNSKGVILVFDISNRESFEQIDLFWSSYQERQEPQSSSKKVVVLVGNKTDLRKRSSSSVRADEALEWLRRKNLSERCYLEACLFEPASINAIFDLAARQVARMNRPSPAGRSRSKQPSSLPRIGESRRRGAAPPSSSPQSSSLPPLPSASLVDEPTLRSPQLEKTCLDVFSFW